MTAAGDASSEARHEDQGLRGFVNLGHEVGMSSQGADRGSMVVVIEVMTAERTCSLARRNRYLKGLVCEAAEALDRVLQCSWHWNVEVKYEEEEK